MAIYKIYYSGFVYVESESPEEAVLDFDFAFYDELSVDEVEEVDEAVIEL